MNIVSAESLVFNMKRGLIVVANSEANLADENAVLLCITVDDRDVVTEIRAPLAWQANIRYGKELGIIQLKFPELHSNLYLVHRDILEMVTPYIVVPTTNIESSSAKSTVTWQVAMRHRKELVANHPSIDFTNSETKH